jgi:hypothetical protein
MAAWGADVVLSPTVVVTVQCTDKHDHRPRRPAASDGLRMC